MGVFLKLQTFFKSKVFSRRNITCGAVRGGLAADYNTGINLHQRSGVNFVIQRTGQALIVDEMGWGRPCRALPP